MFNRIAQSLFADVTVMSCSSDPPMFHAPLIYLVWNPDVPSCVWLLLISPVYLSPCSSMFPHLVIEVML